MAICLVFLVSLVCPAAGLERQGTVRDWSVFTAASPP